MSDKRKCVWCGSEAHDSLACKSGEAQSSLAAPPGSAEKRFPYLWVNEVGGTVEIALENVHCHHEWIRGEGADIAIWRAMDDERIVGATLPYRQND